MDSFVDVYTRSLNNRVNFPLWDLLFCMSDFPTFAPDQSSATNDQPINLGLRR